jgi:hypothetical protein
MKEVKTFIYRYDDDPKNEVEETDFAGTIPIPGIDDLLYREDCTWMVKKVVKDTSKAIPVIHVFLAENSAKRPRIVN